MSLEDDFQHLQILRIHPVAKHITNEFPVLLQRRIAFAETRQYLLELPVTLPSQQIRNFVKVMVKGRPSYRRPFGNITYPNPVKILFLQSTQQPLVKQISRALRARIILQVHHTGLSEKNHSRNRRISAAERLCKPDPDGGTPA